MATRRSVRKNPKQVFLSLSSFPLPLPHHRVLPSAPHVAIKGYRENKSPFTFSQFYFFSFF